MLDGLAFSGPRYHENANKAGSDPNFHPCVICGKLTDVRKRGVGWVRVHNGGDSIVTDEEAARLNAEGHEAGDMYYFVVGPDCRRRHREIEAYVVTSMRD